MTAYEERHKRVAAILWNYEELGDHPDYIDRIADEILESLDSQPPQLRGTSTYGRL